MWTQEEIAQFQEILLAQTGQRFSDIEASSQATQLYELIKMLTNDHEYENRARYTSSL